MRRTICTAASARGQTLVEKIAQQYAVGLAPGQRVRAGDFVNISPHRCMSHDNAGAVMKKFASIGVTSVHEPRQLVLALDHNVQDRGEANLKKYGAIEAFAAQHGIDFHPAGTGARRRTRCDSTRALPRDAADPRSRRAWQGVASATK
jgi:homoaconitate hydratase